jgi:hypothetical protein
MLFYKPPISMNELYGHIWEGWLSILKLRLSIHKQKISKVLQAKRWFTMDRFMTVRIR